MQYFYDDDEREEELDEYDEEQYEEEDEYEEEESDEFAEYEDEEYEEENIPQRHHVDDDEQYIVDMLTKDELRRKVEIDLKNREIFELNNAHNSYEQNLFDHGQQDTAIMDDIIREMNQRGKKYGSRSKGSSRQSSQNYYHQ